MQDPDTSGTPESTMPTIDPARASGPPRFLLCGECSLRIAHTGHLVSRVSTPWPWPGLVLREPGADDRRPQAYRGHAGKAALFTTACVPLSSPLC